LEIGRRYYRSHSLKRLSDEDWDFDGLKISERQYGVHFFHHYTAKFIPQIPAKLIRYFCRGNDVVIDPFVGSGTTLVEAKLLGCHSYGLDTNPLAIKIANAKTMLVNEKIVDEIDRFIGWLRLQSEEVKLNSSSEKNITLFDDSHLWFRNDVAYKISLILCELQTYSPDVQNFVEIGLSDLLKGMSNARMDSVTPVLPGEPVYIDRKHYYRQINNLTRQIPVYRRMISQLMAARMAILEFNKETDSQLACKPILADARELSSFVKRCNLVVTSPPYWSAQNYENLHMLSFKLFGLKTVNGTEIGRNSSDYLEDMKKVFAQIAQVLNGYFALVIGEDDKNRQHEKLFETARQVGFAPVDTITRRISNQTSNAKQIKNEFIYVFKL
jgi:DNA modification methylase